MGRKIDVLLFGAILPPIDFRITAGSFPLGLLALASVLKEKGFSVEVISGALKDAPLRLKEYLGNCRYLGISSMSGPYLKMAIEVSKLVKYKYPDVPIIWGGVHATLLPEDTIKHDFVDIIIRGVGEETICQLIEALDKKSPLTNIKGITYKYGGKIISNPDADMLDITKFPSFDYSSFLTYKEEISELPYISSRGCPYGCTFCVASKLYNHKYYYYSAKRMFREIKELSETFGCRRFTFWDDNLFVVKERLKDFCQLLIAANLEVKWSAFCHCDLFLQYEDELLVLLKKAGLETISFGAESGSVKILDLIKKRITPEQVLLCAEKTKALNINSDFTFMTGLPQETVDDLQKTLMLFKAMLKINPDLSIRLFAFTPYPKIPILEEEPELCKYFPETIDGWANLTYQSYIPQWLSRKHRKLIDNIVWMANFLSRKQRPKSNNFLVRLILNFYHLSAVMRLRYNFLFWAPEWKIFKIAYKISTRSSLRTISSWNL